MIIELSCDRQTSLILKLEKTTVVVYFADKSMLNTKLKLNKFFVLLFLGMYAWRVIVKLKKKKNDNARFSALGS